MSATRVDLGEVGLAGPYGLQEVLHDTIEALNLAGAHLQGALHFLLLRAGLGAVELAADEVQMDAQRVERVAQLVGHTGGQVQDAGDLLALDLKLRAGLLLGDVGQNDGVARGRRGLRARRVVQLEGHDVDVEHAVFGIRHLHLARDARQLLKTAIAADVQRARQLWHALPQHGLADLAQGDAQQLRRRCVGILDNARAPDDQDALADRVEHGLQQTPLAGQALDEDREVRRVQVVQAAQHVVQRGAFLGGHLSELRREK
jgi:hypothetical protein